MFGGVRPVGESRGQSVEADAEMDVVVVSWCKTYGRYIGTIFFSSKQIFFLSF